MKKQRFTSVLSDNAAQVDAEERQTQSFWSPVLSLCISFFLQKIFHLILTFESAKAKMEI